MKKKQNIESIKIVKEADIIMNVESPKDLKINFKELPREFARFLDINQYTKYFFHIPIQREKEVLNK